MVVYRGKMIKTTSLSELILDLTVNKLTGKREKNVPYFGVNCPTFWSWLQRQELHGKTNRARSWVYIWVKFTRWNEIPCGEISADKLVYPYRRYYHNFRTLNLSILCLEIQFTKKMPRNNLHVHEHINNQLNKHICELMLWLGVTKFFMPFPNILPTCIFLHRLLCTLNNSPSLTNRSLKNYKISHVIFKDSSISSPNSWVERKSALINLNTETTQ